MTLHAHKICSICNTGCFYCDPQLHEHKDQRISNLGTHRSVRCGQCGSTAIDHTQAQCIADRTVLGRWIPAKDSQEEAA